MLDESWQQGGRWAGFEAIVKTFLNHNQSRPPGPMRFANSHAAGV